MIYAWVSIECRECHTTRFHGTYDTEQDARRAITDANITGTVPVLNADEYVQHRANDSAVRDTNIILRIDAE